MRREVSEALARRSEAVILSEKHAPLTEPDRLLMGNAVPLHMPHEFLDQLNQKLTAWARRIPSPLWYLTVIPEMQSLTRRVRKEPLEIQAECRARIYDFFEQHLVKGDIALGRDLPGADAEREPIDTVVIHHTSNPPGLRQEQLSAIELIRLYAPYFLEPKSEEDGHVKGRPIASGHARNGKQVFWPYHWIIRGDGRAERLLYDREIGWHAGNWDVNCRSVAIALDNDYGERRPSEVELRAIADLIRAKYRQVPLERIVGHREVNSKTACPSNLFLGGPHGRGWKRDLLEMIQEDETALRTAA